MASKEQIEDLVLQDTANEKRTEICKLRANKAKLKSEIEDIIQDLKYFEDKPLFARFVRNEAREKLDEVKEIQIRIEELLEDEKKADLESYEVICKLLNDIEVNSPSDSSYSHCHIYLPPPKLSTFDGNIMNWMNWWAEFEANVHNNKSLSSKEKLNILLTLLKGGAACSKFSLLEYHTVVDHLKKTYDKKDVIAARLYLELTWKTLPMVKNETDVRNLKKLLNSVYDVISKFHQLGRQPISYEEFLKCKIMHNLPFNLRIRLEGEKKGITAPLKTVLEALELQLRCMEQYAYKLKK